MNRWLIIFGVVLIAAGLLWPLLNKIGLGRLPGDVVIERESFRFYFPIVTSLIISIVFSLLLWLLNRCTKMGVPLNLLSKSGSNTTPAIGEETPYAGRAAPSYMKVMGFGPGM